MYPYLVFAHSWLRWIFLALVVLVLVQSWLGYLNKQNFTEGNRKSSLFLLIATHLQLVLGLLLYGIFSPNTQQAFKDFGAAMRDSNLRFWAVEHISVMLIGIVLIQIGYSKAKRATESQAKHWNLAIFTTIAVVLMLTRINWTPLFRGL